MRKKILLVVSILFALVFINSGLNKFFNYMPVPDDLPPKMMEVFGAFMTIGWLMPLIAIVEIVGGILVAIPKTRALGAIMLLPIMIGILLTHALQAPSGLPMAIVLAIILLWIIIEERRKYFPMVQS